MSMRIGLCVSVSLLVGCSTLRSSDGGLKELEQRRAFILRAVDGRDDVSEKMRRRIERCRSRTELEYLYEPFRPPRKLFR